MRREAQPIESIDFALSAWVDESVITAGARHPLGLYTLAAVVADAACEDIREGLRELPLTRGGRLHWVDESAKRRDQIVAAISALDLAAIVAVGTPVHKAKQERARRCCMEQLFYQLGALGVTQVWLESRSTVPDRLDLQLLDSARGKGLVPDGFKVAFARPRDEPMLWLPDAVAGAVTAANLGDPRWLVVLSEIVTQYEVSVR